MNRIKEAINILKFRLIREVYYSSITPTQALLFMTYRCTSNCKMCTIWQRGKNSDISKELSLEDWKKCVDRIGLKKLNVIEIFGGDCLIRKDVTIPLIKYMKSQNPDIIIDMPTNSNLLDKKTAQELVKSGVNTIYISLDGPFDIHSKIRGNKKTSSKVKSAIENLVDAKKKLNSETPVLIINCTISKLNINNFEQIIPIVEKLGVDSIDFEYVGEFKQKNIDNTKINGMRPTPFYIMQDSSNLLDESQAKLLKKKMNDIKKSAKNYNIHINTDAVDSLTIEEIKKGIVPNKKCYFSRYNITIDPYGNVMGCFHFNNYIIGNIKDEDFEDIWKNKKHLAFLDSQKKGKIKICENCISGVQRNPTFFQFYYRAFYFKIRKKGFE
jgi:MoaA/NifB/PqqE/SkfB family radical SAM enzyme